MARPASAVRSPSVTTGATSPPNGCAATTGMAIECSAHGRTRTHKHLGGRSDGHTDQTRGIHHPLVVRDKTRKAATQQLRSGQVDRVKRS